MSSVITGERIGDMQLPVTWAAIAAAIQLLVVLVPGMIWAGGLNARVSANEKWREEHSQASVHRVEFEKLDADAVRRKEFDRVLHQLDRIEAKLDALK